MRGFLSQKSGRARHLGVSVGASLGVSVGVSLCAGALLAGPLSSVALASPTLGGDENGPQVQILQPRHQDVLKGKTKILIAVKTQKFNPQFVEMFIDGKPATSAPIPVSAMPSAQYDWDTKLFSDGPHKLMVRITDTQGFRGWAEVNIFINNQKKIDTAPPSLSWKNAASFQQLSGTASIQLETLDNFGVKWLFVSLKAANETDKKASAYSWMLNRPPYIVKFDTTKVPDGLYQLSAKAYDAFEQEGEAPPLTIGVVNSSVNATTVGDALAGMERIEVSNRKTIAPPKASSAANSTKNEASVRKTANPTTVEAPDAKTTVVTAKAATIAAPKTPLLPSVPPMIVRSASAQTKAPAKVATTKSSNQLEVAQAAQTPVQSELSAPQLSTRASSQVARPATRAASERAASEMENEISGAMSEDWRTQLARVAVPQIATPRVAVPQVAIPAEAQSEFSGGEEAILSSPTFGAATQITELERSAGAPGFEFSTSNDEKIGATRLAMPQFQERSLDGAPAWSEFQLGAAPLLTPNAPLPTETPASERAGRFSVPATLMARSETVESESVENQSATLAPQISELSSAPQPKISAIQGLKARLDAAKTPVAVTLRAGKVASPQNRIAALPRAQKTEKRGAISAITVSPLQVNLSDTLPAFHAVERTTNLSAVAARYGLPVEVLAANNGWKADKTLAAGESVQLPKQLKVAYRGVPVSGDSPSMLVGGTGVTAFRFMFEMAGGKLEWDAKKQRVIARKGDSEIVLNIGSNRAKVGDKDVMLELAAFLFEGRTMVPLRFFEEGLRAQVEWDPQTGRLVVAMAG